jgi:hypothetical protein
MSDRGDQPAAIAKEAMNAYLARLEAALDEAMACAMDLAVAEASWNEQTMQLTIEMVKVPPYTRLPPDRRWTVYHCSKGVGGAATSHIQDVVA